jgi:hypothetical protein
VHTVHYWSVDSVGTVETSKTATIEVDSTPPLLSINAAGQYTVSATIRTAASDSLSGLDHVEMKLDAGAWSTATQISTSAIGAHTVYARAFDVAGNERDVSATFNVVPPPPDTTPPTTTLYTIPTANAAGWNNTSVSVNMSAVDNLYGSGVARIEYQLDSGGTQVYSAPFTISSEGIHTVAYRSIDNSNNAEGFHSATIRIDKTAPQLSSDAAAGYVGSAVIHLAATDALSGLAKIEYALDTSTFTSGTVVATSVLGHHTLQERATDIAGNVVTTSIGFTVTANETTPPSTTLHADPAANADGWNNTSVSVSLSATDGPAGSGVAATYYTLDGTQHTYSAAFAVSSEGTRALTYWSVDTSSNIEPHKIATIRIDETAPSLSLDATSNYLGAASIAATASDALSGLASVELKLDTGAWSAGTQLSTSVAGGHTIYARAFDLAGNERDVSASFNVRVSRSTTTKLSGSSSATLKKTLALSGTVSPSTALGTVAITKTRLSGGVWKSAGSATIKVVSGAFKYSFKPTSRGSWRFVAKYSGGLTSKSAYKSSKSATKSVTVK